MYGVLCQCSVLLAMSELCRVDQCPEDVFAGLRAVAGLLYVRKAGF